MATYKLMNGYKVTTHPAGNGTEFVTENAAGETISTVVYTESDAAVMLTNLRILEALNGAA